MNKLVIVILSGGSGSRLWPLSRESHPKPFIRLPDGQSLLQKTFLRGLALPGLIEVITVTNDNLLYQTLDDYAEVNKTKCKISFILEPVGKNTAPAITLAALKVIKNYGPDTLMLVLSSDHLIQNENNFYRAIKQAEILATNNKLVTFGIPPTAPETGYGYIEADGSDVIQFIEKPSIEKAKDFIIAGNFYWNSGIFLFSANVFIDEMRKFAPHIYDTLSICFDKSPIQQFDNYEKITIDVSTFSKVPEDSIDYALFEKTRNCSVVVSNIDWKDIGSWQSFMDLIPKNDHGNRIVGDVLVHDTKNVSVYAKERLVALIGVDNLIIAETGDTVIVMNKNDTQKVKLLYQQLKIKNDERYKLSCLVHRPWGSYEVIQQTKTYKVKKILVKPHHQLSLQSHKYRSEHWVVVSGVAEIINNKERLILKPSESTFIKAGDLHQLFNNTDDVLEVVEVSTGKYLGEDDIVRYDDKYGRN